MARVDTAVSSAVLRRLGVRGWHLRLLSLANVWFCLGLWIRAKGVDQDERGNAERRALFVGLWPAMIWLMGESVDRCAERRSPRRLRR